MKTWKIKILMDILFLLSYFKANNFDFMIFKNKE